MTCLDNHDDVNVQLRDNSPEYTGNCRKDNKDGVELHLGFG